MQISKLMVIRALASLIALVLGSNAEISSEAGQESVPIPLASEPHHHLMLENEYIRLYQVEVAPHDSVKLHRHDTDAISLSLSNSVVTVRFPGKADVTQKLTNGQIRLQARGYVHSTLVEEGPPFRNVTVELLIPQTAIRNACAPIWANQPLHCEGLRDARVGVPQVESDQTTVGLVEVKSGERIELGQPGFTTLVVALDAGAAQAKENGSARSLNSGDFVWIDSGKVASFRSDGDNEVRLVSFRFQARRPGGGR